MIPSHPEVVSSHHFWTTSIRSSQRTNLLSTESQNRLVNSFKRYTYLLKWLVISIFFPIQKQNPINKYNYRGLVWLSQITTNQHLQVILAICTNLTPLTHRGLAHFNFVLLLYVLSSLNCCFWDSLEKSGGHRRFALNALVYI